MAGAPPWGYREHLPPEAIAGSGGIDSASGDVYALGVTLYRLLNGDEMMRTVATPAANLETLIAAGRYPDRSKWQLHVHDGLRRVVRKAIHKDASRRFKSASELRHALEGVRPVLSWLPLPTAGDGMAWDGVEVQGGAMWRARLSRNQHGEWVFELQRQVPGGQFRTRRSDGFVGDTLSAATAHATGVLRSVATESR